MKNLTTLNLAGTQVADADLRELAAVEKLTSLHLFATPVTDAGMKELARLKNLTVLHLGNTAVTDAGLKELVVLKNLVRLDLTYTKVTAAGVDAPISASDADARHARTARNGRLLVPQRFDGVQAAGLPGGIIAEEHAHRGGEGQGHGDGLERDRQGPVGAADRTC